MSALVLRPYFNCPSKQIAEMGIIAARNGDLETMSYCLMELSPLRRRRSRSARLSLESCMSELNLEPIPWLERAAHVTHSHVRETMGRHNIYIVLLSGLKNENANYALYVGLTGRTPEKRFKLHKSGIQASRWVKDYGICLLPSLYDHFNPMGYSEAKELETEIARELKEAGIAVYGGH